MGRSHFSDGDRTFFGTVSADAASARRRAAGVSSSSPRLHRAHQGPGTRLSIVATIWPPGRFQAKVCEASAEDQRRQRPRHRCSESPCADFGLTVPPGPGYEHQRFRRIVTRIDKRGTKTIMPMMIQTSSLPTRLLPSRCDSPHSR